MLVCVFLTAGCYTGPGADHFLAVIEALSIPASWEVAETSTRGPGEANSCSPSYSTGCPGATRIYLAEGDRLAVRHQAEEMVTAAGFTFDNPRGDADCSSGTAGGRPCAFFAERDGDRLYLRVYDTPTDAGLNGGNSALRAVVITASGT